MTDSTDKIFEEVRDIIAEFQLVDRSTITMDTDICMDLGVAGDDGNELFTKFDEAFEIEWTGLDLGVHFGNEGWGLPPPWQISNNCVMYHDQPCRVSDVVQAVETGRWPGTKLVRRSDNECRSLYRQSVFRYVTYGAIFAGCAILFLNS